MYNLNSKASLNFSIVRDEVLSRNNFISMKDNDESFYIFVSNLPCTIELFFFLNPLFALESKLPMPRHGPNAKLVKLICLGRIVQGFWPEKCEQDPWKCSNGVKMSLEIRLLLSCSYTYSKITKCQWSGYQNWIWWVQALTSLYGFLVFASISFIFSTKLKIEISALIYVYRNRPIFVSNTWFITFTM